MTEAEYNLRLLMYRTGQRLEGDTLDDDELVNLGKQLIAESLVCPHCDGTGEDGDPDGGSYACSTCGGKAIFEVCKCGQRMPPMNASIEAKLDAGYPCPHATEKSNRPPNPPVIDYTKHGRPVA